MAIQRDRGLTYDAELLLKQSHTVQYRQWIQRYRRVRHIVYDFLDHPSSNFTVGSVLYHISAFLAVLIAVILGASTDSLEDHQWMITIYSALETTLAVFFLLEFLVRMWAISADAKYMGFKGHLRYLRKFVCITDIIIIIVTFVILIVDKRYVSDKTMDYLRFIQILRLFHIDRQMTTWRLIRNMVSISRRELTSAYYITFVLFVLLANLVYYTEHFETEPYSFFLENSTASKTQIPTLAHAWWFSAVTITTIGYGDIVPQFWFSKVIVCVLGFLAYCTFVTASTQISVGLTLMMEEDNKNEYKKRLKHASASLIQNWWRYHMASALMKDSRYRTTFFKKRRHQKMSQIEWKSPLRLGATQIALQPTGLPVGTTMKRLSQPHLSRHMSLPAQDLNSAGARPRTMVHQTTVEDMSQFYSMKQASIDTNNSFSFDGSDSDHSYPLHEEPSINSLSAVDEKLLLKYKPLLRFIFFLVFQILMKKFQRLKKADKLLEMEAEIVEQIHERDQKLNELEMEFTKITGKPSVSMLDPKGDKLSLLSRVDLCEQKVSELGKRADVMNDLANIILRLVQDPPPDGTLPNLPPAPPGRVPKRSSLQRQSRTTFLEEDELV